MFIDFWFFDRPSSSQQVMIAAGLVRLSPVRMLARRSSRHSLGASSTGTRPSRAATFRQRRCGLGRCGLLYAGRRKFVVFSFCWLGQGWVTRCSCLALLCAGQAWLLSRAQDPFSCDRDPLADAPRAVLNTEGAAMPGAGPWRGQRAPHLHLLQDAWHPHHRHGGLIPQRRRNPSACRVRSGLWRCGPSCTAARCCMPTRADEMLTASLHVML
jgi:hypothetical protein